jgi:hypothetical protein
MEKNGKKTSDNSQLGKSGLNEKKESKSIDKSSDNKTEKVDRPLKWSKSKHSFVVAGNY